MSPERLQEVLTERANNPCHRCGHPDATILRGAVKFVQYLSLPVQGGGAMDFPRELTAAAVVCPNCGCVTFHAVGPGWGLEPLKEKTP